MKWRQVKEVLGRLRLAFMSASAIGILLTANFVAILTMPRTAHAIDVAILDAPVNEIDKRNDYTNILLTQILQHTQPKYGPFRVEYAPSYMYRDRLLTELKRGVVVNVTAKATRPDWEDSELLTLRIPVDKGITEYRIALIRVDDQEKFSHITDIEELKRLTLGVGHAWSTRQVFQMLNFKYEAAADWEGLYKMLVAGRFDYFPRAFLPSREQEIERTLL